MLRVVAERPELVGGVLVGLGLVVAVALRFSAWRSIRAAWSSGWLVAVPLLALTWTGVPALVDDAAAAGDAGRSALLGATAATAGIVGGLVFPLILIVLPRLSGTPVPLSTFPVALMLLFAVSLLYPLVLLAGPGPGRTEWAVALALTCLVLLLPFTVRIHRLTTPAAAAARLAARATKRIGRGGAHQATATANELERLAELAGRAFAVRDSEGVRAAAGGLGSMTAQLAHYGYADVARDGVRLLRTTGLGVGDDPRAGLIVVGELDQLKGLHDLGAGEDVAGALADLALHAADRPRGPLLPAALRALGRVGESGAKAFDEPAVTTVIDALAGVARRGIQGGEPRAVAGAVRSLRDIGATTADSVLSLRNRTHEGAQSAAAQADDLERAIRRAADALASTAARLAEEDAALAPLLRTTIMALGSIGEITARGQAQPPSSGDAVTPALPVRVLPVATVAVIEALTGLGLRLPSSGPPSPLHAVGAALWGIGTATVEGYREGGPGPEAEQLTVAAAVALGELARSAGAQGDLGATTSLVAALERLGGRVVSSGLELGALQALDMLAAVAREAAATPERTGVALEAVEAMGRVGAGAVDVNRLRTAVAAVAGLARAIRHGRDLHARQVADAAVTAAKGIAGPERVEDPEKQPGLARVAAWAAALAADAAGTQPFLNDVQALVAENPVGSGPLALPGPEAVDPEARDLELRLRATVRPAAEHGRRYAGERPDEGWEIRVSEEGRDPRRLYLPERVGPFPGQAYRRWRFRFDGFTWGAEGPGAALLALALVLDALGPDARCPNCLGGTGPPGLPLCCGTCRGVGDHPGVAAAAAALERDQLVHLPEDQSWTVTEREVRSWLTHGALR